MVREEFRAVFTGAVTTAIFWCKYEDDNLYIRKPNKGFPFIKKWVLQLSNVHDLLTDYEERVFLDPNDGRTEIKVRHYPFDFDTMQRYHTTENDELSRRYKSVLNERNMLYSLSQEMGQLLKVAGMQDLLKTKFKDDYSFFTGLKPGFMMNQKDDKTKKK